MAVRSQLYSNNFGFALGGGGGGGVSQDYVDNGFGLKDQFCFNLEEQLMKPQNYKQLQLFHQKNQNLCFENSVLLPKNDNHPSFSRSISDQMEKQSQEIDQYIRIQNERLRLALLEQRKRQLSTILKKYESRAQVLLRQKDEEIAKAVNRKLELENLLRVMEIETQTWERVAKENEAIVMSLNSAIEQLRESAVCLSTNGPEDAESCCDVMVMEDRENRGEKRRGESSSRGFQENEEQRRRKLICKICNSGNSCVIFLPCRHLCSCKACEAFLDSCPVCGMAKKSSIEALF